MREDGQGIPGDPLAVPDPQWIKQLNDLCNQGSYFSAWQQAQAQGALNQWGGSAMALLSARFHRHLGNHQRASALTLLAQRRAPHCSRTEVHALWVWCQRRGPGFVLRQYRAHPQGPNYDDPKDRMEWLRFFALLHARHHDLKTAFRLIDLITTFETDPDYVQETRAIALSDNDRIEEAFELMGSGDGTPKTMYPTHWVSFRAHLMTRLSRMEEAEAYLSQWAPRFESPSLLCSWASVLEDSGRTAEAIPLYQRALELSPLARRETLDYYHGTIGRLHHIMGDRAAAREAFSVCKADWASKLRQAIDSAEDRPGRRVHLRLRYVEQHHHTCAPASLAMIGQYWNAFTQHLEIAEEICYNGTPDYKIVRWLRSHGWHVRLFSLNSETLRRVLDQAVPLGLLTSESKTGHMQTICGYDDIIDSLILQDPNDPSPSEIVASKFLEGYGPGRGLALAIVPAQESSRLEGITFPDSDLQEHLIDFAEHLAFHRRAEAAHCLKLMQEIQNDHILTHHAVERLAFYDSNYQAALEALDRQIALAPDSRPLMFRRLDCLFSLNRLREARRYGFQLLETGKADAAVLDRMIHEMLDDARRREECQARIRQYLRWAAASPDPWSLSSRLAYLEGRPDDYREDARLAWCLSPLNEHLAKTFAVAARRTGHASQALDELRERAELLGTKSPEPFLTWARALEDQNLVHEAESVLQQAEALHPEDVSVLLYRAQFALGFGHTEQAEEALLRIEDKVHWQAKFQMRARIARAKNDPIAEKQAQEEILQRAPVNYQALQAIARILRQIDSAQAAYDYVLNACEQHPENIGALALAIEFAPGIEFRLPRVLAYLEQVPESSWALRELAYCKKESGDGDEALAILEQAEAIEPDHWFCHYTRADILMKNKDRAAARESIRRAIRCEVDFVDGLARYWFLTSTAEEEELWARDVFAEMLRQNTNGEAIRFWMPRVQRVLPLEEIEQLLEQARTTRPNVPDIWLSQAQFHEQLGMTDRALELINTAAERFPLHLAVRTEAARMRIAFAQANAVEQYEPVYALSPANADLVCQYARALQEAGNPDLAIQILQRGLRDHPHSVDVPLEMAQVLASTDQPDEAIQMAMQALRLTPVSTEQAQVLSNLLTRFDRPQQIEPLFQELAQHHGQSPLNLAALATALPDGLQALRIQWLTQAAEMEPDNEHLQLVLTHHLLETQQYDQALQAIETALPHLPTLHVRARHAEILTEMDRTEEAIPIYSDLRTEWPRETWLAYRLQRLYGKTGRWEAQIEICSQILQIHPESVEALWSIAHAHELRDDYARALPYWQRAVNADKEDVDIRFRHAQCVYYGGAQAKGCELMLDVPEDYPNALRPSLVVKHYVDKWRRGKAQRVFAESLKTYGVDDFDQLLWTYQVLSGFLSSSQPQRAIYHAIARNKDNPPVGLLNFWPWLRANNRLPIGDNFLIRRIVARLPLDHPARLAFFKSRIRHKVLEREDFQRVLRNGDDPLRTSPQHFADCAEAFFDSNQHRMLLKWMRAAQPDSPLPMSVRALEVRSLASLGRLKAARTLTLRLVKTQPQDKGFTWVAAIAAMTLLDNPTTENKQEASNLLHSLSPQNRTPDDNVALDVVRLQLQCLVIESDSDRRACQGALERLWRTFSQAYPSTRKLLRPVLRRLSFHHLGLWRTLLHWFK